MVSASYCYCCCVATASTVGRNASLRGVWCVYPRRPDPPGCTGGALHTQHVSPLSGTQPSLQASSEAREGETSRLQEKQNSLSAIFNLVNTRPRSHTGPCETLTQTSVLTTCANAHVTPKTQHGRTRNSHRQNLGACQGGSTAPKHPSLDTQGSSSGPFPNTHHHLAQNKTNLRIKDPNLDGAAIEFDLKSWFTLNQLSNL